MSFILEALRKSEQERQRNLSPGMADLHARHRSTGRRYWLPLVIFLIGINIGLLLFLWINGAPPAGEPVSSTAAPAPDLPVTAPGITQPSPVQATTDEAAAAPINPGPGTTDNMTPELQAEPTPVAANLPERDLASELVPRPAASVTGESVSPASTTYGATQSSAYSNLPTLAELTLAGTIDLAPLRIDMHVFSPQASERFVFINMQKYREGDNLREGPALNAITEDGVVLSHQGRTFLVTRE